MKLVARDRGTHFLGDVMVFIRIEAIFMLFIMFFDVCLHLVFTWSKQTSKKNHK